MRATHTFCPFSFGVSQKCSIFANMLDINQFISKYVTERPSSLFLKDIAEHRAELEKEIGGKKVLVIGGAGSIGSSYIKAVLPFKPSQLMVVDLSENGLAELTRDLRSSEGMFVPEDYRTYTLNFADPIFERIFRENGGFDIVANFSAHKHVRSEKDKYSVQALIENNDIKAKRLLDLLAEIPPQHFFCVSTDKAANPVNIMGASKRIMEDLIMAYTSTATGSPIRRKALFRLARRKRTNLHAGLYAGKQRRNILPQTGRSTDDDL